MGNIPRLKIIDGKLLVLCKVDIANFSEYGWRRTICLNLKGDCEGSLNDREEFEEIKEDVLDVTSSSLRLVDSTRTWIKNNKDVLELCEQRGEISSTLMSLMSSLHERPTLKQKLKLKAMMTFNNDYKTIERGNKMDEKKLKKLIIGAATFVVVVVLVIASMSIISPTQRGVKITLGKAGDTVLQPGLTLKAPFFQSVKKYDLSPKSLDLKFGIESDAAVTSDMQSISCDTVVYWTYDDTRILDIVNGYSDSSIKTLVRDNTLGAIKEVIGKYSIYNIVESQEEVTEKVKNSLVSRLANYPVTISSVTINNWDWSAAFDEQIQATMTMTQKVKIAQQELEVTKQQAQKQVAEANAAKEKAVIEAEMKVEVAKQTALANQAQAEGEAIAAELRAEGTAQATIKKAEGDAQAAIRKAEAEAEAKKLEGEALAKYYDDLSKYQTIIETMRTLDINEIEADNWDGRKVPTYLPLTAAGGIVTLND